MKKIRRRLGQYSHLVGYQQQALISSREGKLLLSSTPADWERPRVRLLRHSHPQLHPPTRRARPQRALRVELSLMKKVDSKFDEKNDCKNNPTVSPKYNRSLLDEEAHVRYAHQRFGLTLWPNVAKKRESIESGHGETGVLRICRNVSAYLQKKLLQLFQALIH